MTHLVEKQNPGLISRRLLSVTRSAVAVGVQRCRLSFCPDFIHCIKTYSCLFVEKPDMENRKRPQEADRSFKTPVKRPLLLDPLPDYMQWGAEETCQYLRREGLGEWEHIFRGRFCRLVAKRDTPEAACFCVTGAAKRSLDSAGLFVTFKLTSELCCVI